MKSTIPTLKDITADSCGRCGRPLKSDKSKNKGFGPKCFRKWKAEGQPIQTELDEFLEAGKWIVK